MIVRRYTDPAAYRDRVRDFLECEEAINNLPLGIVFRLAEVGKEAGVRQEEDLPLLALVEDEGRIALIMLMTPPHNLIVSGPTSAFAPSQSPPSGEGKRKRDPCPVGSQIPVRVEGREGVSKRGPSPGGGGEVGVIDAAVSFLIRESISPPGVIGSRAVATRFVSAWCAHTGCTPTVRTEQMIYRLDRVNPIAYGPGALIQAAEAHLDLVAEWMIGFSEITPEGRLEREDAQGRAEQSVGAGRVYLWCDEAPVSMAWKTRPTGHGITVSGVYTPPALRRRGYATSCVAALSQLLLDEGYAYCTLYTDLANPTSNHIYQEIGYCPIQDSIDYTFAPPT
jgi:GNAT superfamily N-acetyltransferase